MFSFRLYYNGSVPDATFPDPIPHPDHDPTLIPLQKPDDYESPVPNASTAIDPHESDDGNPAQQLQRQMQYATAAASSAVVRHHHLHNPYGGHQQFPGAYFQQQQQQLQLQRGAKVAGAGRAAAANGSMPTGATVGGAYFGEGGSGKQGLDVSIAAAELAQREGEERRKVLREVKEHLDLLKEFEGAVPEEDLRKKKRELFMALPSAPPPRSKEDEEGDGEEGSTKRQKASSGMDEEAVI